MSKPFKRVWRVRVAAQKSPGDKERVYLGTETSELRIAFAVKKTLKKEPNTLDLSVTNYSEQTRTQLRSPNLLVELEAGYEGASGLIFSGDVRRIDNTLVGPDWTTRIQCGDGEFAFKESRINKTYEKGASGRDVIKDVVKGMGLDLDHGAVKFIASLPNLVRGLSLSGNAADELTDACKKNGLDWSIQNGKVQIVDARGEAATSAVLLSPETGLLAAVDHAAPSAKGGPPIVRLSCLLNPSLVPGGVVVVRSQGVSGEFVIQEVTHKGDSHGSDWISELELVARKV